MPAARDASAAPPGYIVGRSDWLRSIWPSRSRGKNWSDGRRRFGRSSSGRSRIVGGTGRQSRPKAGPCYSLATRRSRYLKAARNAGTIGNRSERPCCSPRVLGETRTSLDKAPLVPLGERCPSSWLRPLRVTTATALHPAHGILTASNSRLSWSRRPAVGAFRVSMFLLTPDLGGN